MERALIIKGRAVSLGGLVPDEEEDEDEQEKNDDGIIEGCLLRRLRRAMSSVKSTSVV